MNCEIIKPESGFEVLNDERHKDLFEKIKKAYELNKKDPTNWKLINDYDFLVDQAVDDTEGKYLASLIDPMTCDFFTEKGINIEGLSYNQLCEFQGGIAFGE